VAAQAMAACDEARRLTPASAAAEPNLTQLTADCKTHLAQVCRF
jgi:hypothetical protein